MNAPVPLDPLPPPSPAPAPGPTPLALLQASRVPAPLHRSNAVPAPGASSPVRLQASRSTAPAPLHRPEAVPAPDPTPLAQPQPRGPSLPASTSSSARNIVIWKRETTATTCASTRRWSFRRSATNDLIGNFKKPPRLRGTPAWAYKERAIDRLAAELATTLDPAWLSIATLVPIPPSRARSDPDHDDRLLRLLHRLAHLHPAGVDIRELLVQRRSIPPFHAAPGRPTPTALAAHYDIDETLATPPPRALGLFDDVLTTGAHFKAAQQVLRRRFPGTPIAGIFLARTPTSFSPRGR